MTLVTSRVTIHRDPEEATGKCPHCSEGWIYEPTADALEAQASECHMCLGTGRKMSREERKVAKAAREIDVHHSGLERMGS